MHIRVGGLPHPPPPRAAAPAPPRAPPPPAGLRRFSIQDTHTFFSTYRRRSQSKDSYFAEM